MSLWRIVAAKPEDVPSILGMIRELADYEHLTHLVECDEARLQAALFGPQPCIEAVLMRNDESGEVAAYALWFTTFSTFIGKPGLWLEDIYVKPAYRRQGHARHLLAHLAALTVARGYGRFEWSVLDWNTPAQDFYRSIGADILPDWRITRMVGDSLTRFAAENTAENSPA